jgi:hypothetical protein
MAAPRNTFEDPNNVRPDYEWHINHDEEGDFGKERRISHGANTATTGLVRQQADDDPLIMQLSGVILHQAQYDEMIAWFALSKTQTLYFEDFAGDRYEILFTSFKPKRFRTIKNPRDFANAPYWFWKYELTFEVVRFLTSNPWSAAGP